MQNKLNPSRLYRNDLLSWRACELGLSDMELARQSKVGAPTVARVLKGQGCGVKTLWAIADALKINRQSLIDFKLKERDFRQAVTGKRGAEGGRGQLFL